MCICIRQQAENLCLQFDLITAVTKSISVLYLFINQYHLKFTIVAFLSHNLVTCKLREVHSNYHFTHHKSSCNNLRDKESLVI